jgi:hypothetical protein
MYVCYFTILNETELCFINIHGICVQNTGSMYVYKVEFGLHSCAKKCFSN